MQLTFMHKETVAKGYGCQGLQIMVEGGGYLGHLDEAVSAGCKCLHGLCHVLS